MRPFTYLRVDSLADAARLPAGTGQGEVDAKAQFLAGGTTLLDLMKLDVLRPEQVVDLQALRAAHAGLEVRDDRLRLGAFATMSEAAWHGALSAACPALADSLRLAASAQLRNMATLGGNVLQKTRCPYFRDTSWGECNKRRPGSGCAAIGGVNHNHAVLGVDDSCIAQYPGDFAIVLVAFGAEVDLTGPQGPRRIPFADLHRGPDGQPHRETTLRPGEVITAFALPAAPWARRSVYVKVRDRASYEFAIASAAVGLEMDGDVVLAARIGLGGMAYRPWRAEAAEAALVGRRLDPAAAEAAASLALRDAVTHGGNDHKPDLARRTIVHALMSAAALPA